MNNNELLNQVTMIIPTHERHSYLKRILDYYADSPFKIIICDSSKEIFSDFEPSCNFEYIHIPDVNFVTKIALITNKLTTPYCVMCADDDFISVSGITKSISFLEKNNDFSSAGGRYVSFSKIPNEVYCYEDYLYAINCKISSDNVTERLTQVFDPYFPFFYSVHKTDTIKKAFPLIKNSLEYKNARLMEISFIMISVIEGKHKTLPFFYAARDNNSCNENDGTNTIPRLYQVWDKSSYSDEKENFYSMMTDYVMSETNLSTVLSRKAIKNSIHMFLKNSMKNKNENSGKIVKIILEIPKYLIGNITHRYLSSKLKKTFNVSYPFNDVLASREWFDIEKYIIKHNN